MLNLGSFRKDEQNGKISGVFYGVNMTPTKLIFEPAISDKGKPYYKVYAETELAVVEAGAAWPKVAKTARAYLDVKLDSPGLAQTFYGKLVESDVLPHQHQLLWEAPELNPRTEATPSRRSVNAAPAP